MLLKVTWAACEECKYHMGDRQWGDVEVAINSAIEDAKESDDAYEDRTVPSVHVDALVTGTGKNLVCTGCEEEFYSLPGLSAKCTGCR